MKELIMVLLQKDKAALGAVRCLPGLQAAEAEGFIWLRGIRIQENSNLAIRQLPVLHTYTLDEDNNLFPLKGLTPVARLQPMNWIPVAKYVSVELPVSALPGKVHRQLVVRLAPSQQTQEGNALLTGLSLWKAYAEQAPLVRLQQTRFAASEKNKVLVIGNPLPALPGREYVLQGTLLIPCGYTFDPPVISTFIADRFDPDGGSLLLFDINGTWQQIPVTAFMPSTRSAIRLTKGTDDE